MKKSGVYKISNRINDSIYIGSSAYIKSRISQHKSTLRKNKNSNWKLQAFFNKHGINNLVFEILDFCDTENLKEVEQYYLDLYKDKFNISQFSCSTKGVPCPNYKKKLISQSLKKAGLKGIPKSEETKAKMRKPKTKQHAMNIKIAQKDVIKTVYQYDSNLNLVATFESINSASKELGIDRSQISANCNNRQKSCKGFIFKFYKL